jgi:hypothetical protein
VSKTKSATGKPLKAVVGAAHHALRAYCKAYDLRSKGQVQHRYSIATDGRSAAILDGDGNEVESRRIEEWAATGPRVRRALIALKFMQEQLRDALPIEAKRADITYMLNIIEGRAGITINGLPLSRDALRALSPGLSLGDTTRGALDLLDRCALDTVEGWATLGKHVEVDFFQILQSAERYGLKEAAREQRQRGYRLSIIRKPKA